MHTNGTKASDPASATDDGQQAQQIMQGFYRALLEDAFQDAAAEGVDVIFDLANPHVQTVLDQLGKKIKGIAETTREDIRALVGRQAEEGWSTEQLQKEIRDKGAVSSRSRATMIARTETGNAYNLGALAAYTASGVTHVQVMDGDDDEPCASANGAIWTVEQAQANPLEHPNCTRAFAPIVE